MSSSIFRVEWRFKCLGLEIAVESCIFAKFLISTTMQDGSIRERSEDDYGVGSLSSKIKRKKKRKIKSRKYQSLKYTMAIKLLYLYYLYFQDI